MRILVPVKQVARLGGDFALDGSEGVARDALTWQLNEWDAFSLEAAVQLLEGCDGGEVVVASVGDEHAEEGLRACLARGAQRAMRVWDPALLDADPLSVAFVLAALAARVEPDLIFCGVQSSDAANAATGIALAGLLDMTHVAVVNVVERDGQRLIVHRELDGGAVEVLGLSMPALLTVQSAANEPRSATLRAIKQARAMPVEELGLSALGLAADSVRAMAGSRIVALAEPMRAGGASMLDGPPREMAARIAEIVRERMAS